MPNIAKYLKQTVEVTTQTAPGGGFYGDDPPPKYSTPRTVPARKIIKQNEVRSAGGTEVIASTEVWLLDEIAIGDTIDGEAVQDRENVVSKDGAVLFWRAFL